MILYYIRFHRLDHFHHIVYATNDHIILAYIYIICSILHSIKIHRSVPQYFVLNQQYDVKLYHSRLYHVESKHIIHYMIANHSILCHCTSRVYQNYVISLVKLCCIIMCYKSYYIAL